MGNQQAMCCSDHTGFHRSDIAATSSFDMPAHGGGKPRFLRRVMDTLRPSSRHHMTQPSKFIKEKFASSNLEMKPLIDDKVSRSSGAEYDHKAPNASYRLAASQVPSGVPPPQHQLRTFSSISTQSELGERMREARSECVTRRASYCSAREDIEDDREPLEPEGYIETAVE
jgi:hypothetical protein